MTLTIALVGHYVQQFCPSFIRIVSKSLSAYTFETLITSSDLRECCFEHVGRLVSKFSVQDSASGVPGHIALRELPERIGDMRRSNPLGRLIDATREANNGWSDEYIARRARSAGHQMSKSTISDIRVKGLSTIVPHKLKALSAGLDLPLADVTRAALETVGLPVGAPGNSVEQAIQRDVSLPITTKRTLLTIVREARRSSEQPPELPAAASRGEKPDHRPSPGD